MTPSACKCPAWRPSDSTIYFIVQALDGNPATRGAWETVHALSYHTYATDFDTIVNETTSLHQQFSKPLWITEIASGADSTAAANLALMQRFVPWANSQPWIERYFWNQAVRYQKQMQGIPGPQIVRVMLLCVMLRAVLLCVMLLCVMLRADQHMGS